MKPFHRLINPYCFRRHASAASLGATLAVVMAMAVTAHAQSTEATPVIDVGVLEKPCDALEPLPAAVLKFMADSAAAKAANKPMPVPSTAGVQIYRDWDKRRRYQDFGGFCKYAADNGKLAAQDPDRVVLLGDSITELWAGADPSLFSGSVVDRGISGQTTAQMVLRFQQDVIDLKPKAVHIMAGTNDIAGNTGPTSLDWIERNLRRMVEDARLRGIRVIIGSVLPAKSFNWYPGIDPVKSIRTLNERLKKYADEQCITYVDYYSPMVDGDGGLKAAYTEDGVHPVAAGYQVMRPLLEQSLQAVPPSGGSCPG